MLVLRLCPHFGNVNADCVSCFSSLDVNSLRSDSLSPNSASLARLRNPTPPFLLLSLDHPLAARRASASLSRLALSPFGNSTSSSDPLLPGTAVRRPPPVLALPGQGPGVHVQRPEPQELHARAGDVRAGPAQAGRGQVCRGRSFRGGGRRRGRGLARVDVRGRQRRRRRRARAGQVERGEEGEGGDGEAARQVWRREAVDRGLGQAAQTALGAQDGRAGRQTTKSTPFVGWC